MKDKIKHILAVDDEPDLLAIIDFMLKNNGFKPTTLSDPTKALEELLTGNYSMVILDLMMPVMDGFALLLKIRATDKLKDIPVLILSAKQISLEETQVLTRYKAQTLSKPFESQRLIEKIRDLIGG